MNFSVLMSVYRNDNPAYFRTAIESISIHQTVQPNEIYIYVDGTVPKELEDTINQLQEEISTINVHWEKENKGLGYALQYGMEHVKNELVARMDSDDISTPDRFKKQLVFMKTHPQVSVVGGQISEFIDDPKNIVGYRKVPQTDKELKRYIKIRCPFNHMTVMFRKKAVLDVGNYVEWHYNEDYYLWIRMALAGCRFANISENLVNVRVGKDMYARRGGWKYFVSERDIQTLMFHKGLINFSRYLYNVVGRFIIQVLMPNRVRGWLFRKVFRKQK